ncbi:MAG: hypothetical protein Kow0077_25070 [Anaerolineae bacterium]
MSEYITLDVEDTEDPQTVVIKTNLLLAPDGPEHYDDRVSGEHGSPLAQTIFAIAGVQALTLEENDMIITFSPETELFVLVDELDAALKDFFL